MRWSLVSLLALHLLVGFPTNALAQTAVFEEYKAVIIPAVVVIVVVIIVWAGLFIAYARERFGHFKGQLPTLTMQEVFDELWELPEGTRKETVIARALGDKSEYYTQIVKGMKHAYAEDAVKDLRDDLLATEKQAVMAPNPLAPLRRAIMKATDNKLLNESLLKLPEPVRQKWFAERVWGQGVHAEVKGSLTDDQISTCLVADAEFRTLALRLYSWLRFDDFSDDDWLQFYHDCAAARFKHLFSSVLKKGSREGECRKVTSK